MTELIVITSLREPADYSVYGPTERGSVSTFTNTCARFVNLQTEARLAAEEVGEEDVSSAFARGILYHKLWEMYHNPSKYDGKKLVFKLDEHHDALKVAQALMDEYVQHIPSGAFGKPLLTETVLGRTKEEAQALADYFGVRSMKVVFDMLTYLGPKEISFWQTRDLALPGPGWYIVDAKTEGKTEQPFKYVHGVQRAAYLAALKCLSDAGFIDLAGKPIKGMIFDRIVANKVPKLLHTVAPMVMPHEIKVVKNLFQQADRRIQADEPNAAACVDAYGRVCRFFNQGCTRI